jgi:uncharacterized membrane protein
MFEAYQGLLPHPDHLARYNDISPGSADKIIDEFVAQGVHRRTQEARVVAGNEKRSGLGQGLGFFLLLAAIVAGTIIAVTSDAKIGGGIITATIVGGAIIYVVGGKPPKSS